VTVRIRPATPADTPGIEAVHIAAFPSDAEARLVSRLAADGDVVLSLVADREGEIVGHVLFSAMDVTAGGKALPSAALAPIAVSPARQAAGIGSALVDHGLADLAEQGVAWVFVLGEPDFYEQFGFDRGLGARFASPHAGDYWMALALDGRAAPRAGEARHARAFAALGETL
jgi:putative acetyltransferase